MSSNDKTLLIVGNIYTGENASATAALTRLLSTINPDSLLVYTDSSALWIILGELAPIHNFIFDIYNLDEGETLPANPTITAILNASSAPEDKTARDYSRFLTSIMSARDKRERVNHITTTTGADYLILAQYGKVYTASDDKAPAPLDSETASPEASPQADTAEEHTPHDEHRLSPEEKTSAEGYIARFYGSAGKEAAEKINNNPLIKPHRYSANAYYHALAIIAEEIIILRSAQ